MLVRRFLLGFSFSLLAAVAPSICVAQAESEEIFTEATDAPAPVRGRSGVVAQIRGLVGTPGDSAWDMELTKILVAAYDSDGSRTINRSSEVADIPCDVFQTLESEFDKSPSYSSAMRAVYGFPRALGWVGGSIGFSEDVRDTANSRWESCTSDEAVAAGSTTVSTGAASGLMPGLRVKRGPDWKWEMQDGGAGRMGTVVGAPSDASWARVRWDHGKANTYRWGHEGKTDLAIVPGKRPSISDVPDLLEAVDKSPGSLEWDNTVGPLMVAAYDTNSSGAIDTSSEARALSCAVFETLESEFDGSSDYSQPMRVVYGFKAGYGWVGGAVGFSEKVRSQVDSEWLRCTGKDVVIGSSVDVLPVGSRVRRGPDWKWEDQDGGPGKLGTVVRAPTAKDWVKVEWDAGGSNTYRWGHSDARDVEVVSGRVSAPAGPEGDLVRAIARSSWTGKASGARDHILPLLVAAYDTDKSGEIDTDAEVERIPCSVVVAVRDRYQRGGAFSSPIRAVFGFEEGYGWVGGALGFDEGMRKQVDAKMMACGLK